MKRSELKQLIKEEFKIYMDAKQLKSLDEEKVMSLRDFEKRLKKHDWTYAMSDDMRVYRAGDQDRDELRKIAQTDKNYQKMFDKYIKNNVVQFSL